MTTSYARSFKDLHMLNAMIEKAESFYLRNPSINTDGTRYP
jgi:hypothetical protein